MFERLSNYESKGFSSASHLRVRLVVSLISKNHCHHTIHVDDALEFTSLERKTCGYTDCHADELINIYALDFISFNEKSVRVEAR